MPSRHTLNILTTANGKELDWFLDTRPEETAHRPVQRPSASALRGEETRTRERPIREAEMALVDATPNLSRIAQGDRQFHTLRSSPRESAGVAPDGD